MRKNDILVASLVLLALVTFYACIMKLATPQVPADSASFDSNDTITTPADTASNETDSKKEHTNSSSTEITPSIKTNLTELENSTDTDYAESSSESTAFAAEMDQLRTFIVNRKENGDNNSDYIALPQEHMDTIRHYVTTVEPTGGLPSVDLSFTGVSCWEYGDMCIYVHDDDEVDVEVYDIATYEVCNLLHFDEEQIQDSMHCRYNMGWVLEKDKLSYWQFNKKIAEYELPETEITDFTVHHYRTTDDNSPVRCASLITPTQIITASKDEIRTFDIDNIFSYFITNTGRIFYVTDEHEMYYIDVYTGECVYKMSDVFCITDGIGYGDGTHTDIEYAGMDGKVHTTSAW